jgi:hypothetical protein
MAEISLELFNRRFEQLNEMHRELRQHIFDMQKSLVTVSRQVVNLDRRLSDVKDELEGTIKLELGGAFAHMETRLEQFIERRIVDLQTPNQFSED